MSIGFGVIGLNIGMRRCETIQSCANARLVAGADLSEKRREMAQEKFGSIGVYADYRELLERPDVDAVFIAVPINFHHEITLAALEAGKHVLCEKPPANNTQQTEEMVKKAAEKGLLLSWGLQRRFIAEMTAAHEAISEGLLGKVYRIHARYVRERVLRLMTDPMKMKKGPGGVMLDLGVHVLDMSWYLMGCPKPTRLVASALASFPDWNCTRPVEDMAEDNVSAMIFFENGACLNLETSWLAQCEDLTGHRPTIRILGDKGGLFTGSMVYCHGGPEEMQQEQLAIRPEWKVDSSLRMVENFCDAITGEDELVIKAEDGVNLMRMIDAIRQSAEEQREIRFDGADA